MAAYATDCAYWRAHVLRRKVLFIVGSTHVHILASKLHLDRLQFLEALIESSVGSAARLYAPREQNCVLECRRSQK
jgi:hypothetical protein